MDVVGGRTSGTQAEVSLLTRSHGVADGRSIVVAAPERSVEFTL